jgi:predicted DNA-binding transcriptional regulator AlpA
MVGVNPTAVSLFYDGNYLRDGNGSWRYAASGVPVPGARDLTLADEVPALRVPDRSPNPTAVWVPRPRALTHPRMKQLLPVVPGGYGSFQLPHEVSGLPWGTRAVIILPIEFWDEHEHDVVGMAAPELHATSLLTVESAAEATGLTPEGLMEYVRRGTFPQPPLRVGRTPAWPVPIVEHWLAGWRPRHQPCAGCGELVDSAGPTIRRQDDGAVALVVCRICADDLVRRLAASGAPAPWTVGFLRSLLAPGG